MEEGIPDFGDDNIGSWIAHRPEGVEQPLVDARSDDHIIRSNALAEVEVLGHGLPGGERAGSRTIRMIRGAPNAVP